MQAAFTTVTMVSRSNLTSDDSLQYYCNGYSDQHRPDQHRREVVLEHSADELFACPLRRCPYLCPFEASTCTPTCKRVYSSSRLSSKHKRSSAAWWTSEYSSPTTTLSCSHLHNVDWRASANRGGVVMGNVLRLSQMPGGAGAAVAERPGSRGGSGSNYAHGATG